MLAFSVLPLKAKAHTAQSFYEKTLNQPLEKEIIKIFTSYRPKHGVSPQEIVDSKTVSCADVFV